MEYFKKLTTMNSMSAKGIRGTVYKDAENGMTLLRICNKNQDFADYQIVLDDFEVLVDDEFATMTFLGGIDEHYNEISIDSVPANLLANGKKFFMCFIPGSRTFFFREYSDLGFLDFILDQNKINIMITDDFATLYEKDGQFILDYDLNTLGIKNPESREQRYDANHLAFPAP